MRLSKIQKFLKINNINYTYSTDMYSKNEYGSISINDKRTNYTSISEITGTRGTTVSGIWASYREDKSIKSFVTQSQENIIKRIQSDMISKKNNL